MTSFKMPNPIWSAIALALTAMAGGADAPPYQHRTGTPLTYIRDYSAGHLEDPAFLDAIAANTPELLVVGKDAPLHHNWGPVAGTGGENQRFGQGEHIRRLSPRELREKMAKIRTMVERLHGMGVRWVMPYICTMTIAGHPERRTGFWEFFDHWDDYTGFGLGPKPEEDPREWLQRTPDGGVLSYYPAEAPYYAPNLRLAACIHHAGWRRHLGNVVRLAAEAGYDGVYMDNNRSTRCHCVECQHAFRAYVAARLSRDEIKRDLRADRLAEVRLSPDADPFLLDALNTGDTARPGSPLRPGVDHYPVKLTWEFWTDSKINFLRELKTIGERARGGEFHIFANTTAYVKGAYEPGRVSTVATFNQSEENGGATGAHPGLVPPEVVPSSSDPVYNRRGFEYKFNQSFSNGMRVGMLTRAGHGLDPAIERAIDQNPRTVSLSIAESAAYGGGGGYKVQLHWDGTHAVRRWRDFFRENAGLFEGGEVWAPIGVIAFAEQFFCGLDKTHQEALKALSLRLLEKNVLFDLVHEGNLSLERLRRFRAVIVPEGVRSLSEAQWEIFRRYAAETPGSLIVLGDDFGTVDDRCRPSSRSPRRIEGASHLPASIPASTLLSRVSETIRRPATILTDSDGKVPAGIGINAYLVPRDGRSGAVLVHLVNYNVPLGRDRYDPPRPVHDLVASLPLPSEWRVTSVRAFSPHPGEELDVRFEQQDGGVRLQIRKLDLYKVIHVAGEPMP